MVPSVLVPRQFWLAWSGPLLTAGVLALIMLVDPMIVPVRQPALLYLPVVVYSAWIGGLGPGMLSAALTLLYAALTLAGPGGWSGYTPENALTLGVLLLVTPLLVIAINRLRRQVQARVATDRRQDAWTATVLDHLDEGVITFDRQGVLETANAAVPRLFGYPQ